jgi:hypothetical protein
MRGSGGAGREDRDRCVEGRGVNELIQKRNEGRERDSSEGGDRELRW